jgi:hypothetical protein
MTVASLETVLGGNGVHWRPPMLIASFHLIQSLLSLPENKSDHEDVAPPQEKLPCGTT